MKLALAKKNKKSLSFINFLSSALASRVKKMKRKLEIIISPKEFIALFADL